MLCFSFTHHTYCVIIVSQLFQLGTSREYSCLSLYMITQVKNRPRLHACMGVENILMQNKPTTIVMNKTGKTSIKREIFMSSMLFSLIILVVFGLFLSNILYHSKTSKAYDILEQKNKAINFFIEGCQQQLD